MLPTIEPMPPVAATSLPWDRELPDPVAALAAARAEHGDTFVVEGPGQRTLFLFSPQGVKSFYGLPESHASKGMADWQMLVRKLPEELFDGRRTIMHELFGRENVRGFLAQLDAAIDVAFDELGDEGAVDVFAFTRRLGHRMGLASWAGETPSRSPRFDELITALDELDGSAAFVHPEAMVADRTCRDGTRRAAHRVVGARTRRRGARRAAGRPVRSHHRSLGRRRRSPAQRRHRARRDPRAPRFDVEPVRRVRVDDRAARAAPRRARPRAWR
jgi:hypothetical protein